MNVMIIQGLAPGFQQAFWYDGGVCNVISHLWILPPDFKDLTAEVEIVFENGRVVTEQVSELALPAH